MAEAEGKGVIPPRYAVFISYSCSDEAFARLSSVELYQPTPGEPRPYGAGETTKPRRPWLAAVLTPVVPGLGQPCASFSLCEPAAGGEAATNQRG